jgi:hypothetical protein
MSHHTEPIYVTEMPARKVAAQLIKQGLYTTPLEVTAIAANLDSPDALSNWDPDFVTALWTALDGYTVEWLTTDYFASVR